MNEAKISLYDTVVLTTNLNPAVPKGTKAAVLIAYDSGKYEIEIVDEEGKNVEYQGRSTFTVEAEWIKKIPKLLPCPFCGDEKPEIERTGTRFRSCIVRCSNCNCKLESNEIGAGDSWNQRINKKMDMEVQLNKIVKSRKVFNHLDEMMNVDKGLYEKILDTTGFAYHFNELTKLAMQ